jgi:hypothetical protein
VARCGISRAPCVACGRRQINAIIRAQIVGDIVLPANFLRGAVKQTLMLETDRSLALEKITGVDIKRMLPTPNINLDKIFAAKAHAPMIVTDKSELSPTVCAAVLRLAHNAVPAI